MENVQFWLVYLGLSGLGGFSIKLLLVALEMGMAGIFFNNDEGSEATQHWSQCAFKMDKITFTIAFFKAMYLCIHCQGVLASQRTAWPLQTTKTALPWTPGSCSVDTFRKQE